MIPSCCVLSIAYTKFRFDWEGQNFTLINSTRGGNFFPSPLFTNFFALVLYDAVHVFVFERGYFQGFSWFIDGTVLTVTTGRDGKTLVEMEVPSRRQLHLPFTRTVPSSRKSISRCNLPSRPVEEISPYRPVSSTKPVPTVPSRLQNLPLPSGPVVKTCPYRQKNLVVRTCPTVLLRHSLPSLLPVRMP